MTIDEAKIIDDQQELLPGGSGEHSFNANSSALEVDAVLNNYAEQCGGIWSLYESMHTGMLTTSDCGDFYINFSADNSQVVRVLKSDNKEYWNRDKARVRGRYYQESNASEELLTTR
jgi:hypothetical protein